MDNRKFLEIHVWICHIFSDQGRPSKPTLYAVTCREFSLRKAGPLTYERSKIEHHKYLKMQPSRSMLHSLPFYIFLLDLRFFIL